MDKPLLIWNMNPIIPDNDLFHHVRPQRVAVYFYMILINTGLKEGMMQGSASEGKKKKKLLRSCLLD